MDADVTPSQVDLARFEFKKIVGNIKELNELLSAENNDDLGKELIDNLSQRVEILRLYALNVSTYLLMNGHDPFSGDMETKINACDLMCSSIPATDPTQKTTKTPINPLEEIVIGFRMLIEDAERYGLVRDEDGRVITGALCSEHGVVLTGKEA
ncbi:hypothetical protein WAX88_16180 [Photobacterium damselae subsp. damselae]|uniref:hypothetical protein n=1 Tax=Photobacterium damselae TaxID=38293 RepID=UPI00311AC8CD